MSRQNKRTADIGFAAITIDGGLISPEQVVAIASATPDQKTAADFGCPKGTSLRDEITRYFRIGQANWKAYALIAEPTVTQTAAFAKSLLEEAFGFSLNGPVTHEREGRRFRIAWEAKNGRVPVVVAAPVVGEKGKLGEGFSRAQPEFGDGLDGRIARRSPAVLLQDWLNANPDFYWGLVFAGDRVRLMRDNASFTRPAYIEADLGAIFRDEMFADFTALWLLIHSSRFGAEDAPASDCALERWREAGMRAGTAARDRLRGNVEDALMALGQGFFDANPGLRQRLDEGAVTMPAYFEQLLRVVYRLIFLAVAEDRDLLHTPGTVRRLKELYADNYGFGYLRDRSSRRAAHDHHADAWEGVKIVFRALEHGQPLLGLPALGSLFARGLTPDLDEAQLPNRALLGAVFKLGWLMDSNRRVRINWRDMATEELGSVYEGLLELVPTRENEGRIFTFAGGAEARGNARKISGSYYTPDSLVQCLLDSALDPVLERTEAEGGADAILDLNVIDPACGSGHFLLGAARRMATRVAQLRNSDAPDYNAAMRDVVRNCIHGVDRNPMAIELAKVALWIESVEPGKPLGFLDANIQCGDSLLGVFDLKALDEGIPDDAYKALTGDDKDTAKYFAKRNKDEKKGQGTLDFIGGGGMLPPAKMAATMHDLRHLSEDSVAQIAEKRRRFAAWEADPKRYATKVACDLYIAAFLLPKKGGVPANANSVTVPTTSHLRTRLGGGQIYGPLEAAAVDAAGFARAFHWPLAFPEVMIGKGGFDVVLGNPPWERIKLQEQEFFASRDQDIANAPNAAARTKLIKALAEADAGSPARQLHQAYETAKRVAEASTVFFSSPKDEDPTKIGLAKASKARRYPWTGRGDVNTYALFAEHFLNLANDKGGAGVIVPTGIATDATTAPFFGHLVSSRRLSGLIDFENRERIFVDVYFRVKFCLLTLGSNVQEAEFAFFLTDPLQLEQKERRFTLSPAQIARINPNTKNASVFRARRDAELTAMIYDRVPVILEEEKGSDGNPWSISFMGMFHMSNDSGLFRTNAQLSADGWKRYGISWIRGEGLPKSQMDPLYEAKMLHQFNHRYADYAMADEKVGVDYREIPHADPETLADENYEITPRYWIPNANVLEGLNSKEWRRDWIVGWRDITNATNQRTLVSCLAPAVGYNDKFHLVFPRSDTERISAFYANLNSLALDFFTRQKLGGTSLKHFVFKQLPILPPSAYSEADLAFIVPRVLELSYTSHSMAPFARDLGYEGSPFAWDEDRRAQLRAELDAWYALAYGLTRDELRYVLDPKDVMGADYPSETFRVLQNNEMKKYGGYRTQRLVLAAYDQLAAGAPDTSAVADLAWQHRIDDPVDVRHIFAAIMKKAVGNIAPTDAKLIALLAAKPHFLMQHLTAQQQVEWRRLVGNDVDLVASPLVASFSRATPEAFIDAIDTLRAERSIRYDTQSRTWDRGAAVYRYASLNWADGRVTFVLHAMRGMASGAILAAVPQEERVWIAQAA